MSEEKLQESKARAERLRNRQVQTNQGLHRPCGGEIFTDLCQGTKIPEFLLEFSKASSIVTSRVVPLVGDFVQLLLLRTGTVVQQNVKYTGNILDLKPNQDQKLSNLLGWIPNLGSTKIYSELMTKFCGGTDVRGHDVVGFLKLWDDIIGTFPVDPVSQVVELQNRWYFFVPIHSQLISISHHHHSSETIKQTFNLSNDVNLFPSDHKLLLAQQFSTQYKELGTVLALLFVVCCVTLVLP